MPFVINVIFFEIKEKVLMRSYLRPISIVLEWDMVIKKNYLML